MEAAHLVGNWVPELPTSGWPRGRGGLTGFTSEQWDALRAAVAAGTQCVTGGCTAGTIDNGILNHASGSGLFSTQELDAIYYGLKNAEPHGFGFEEQGSNPYPFTSAWYNNAQKAVQSWLSSAPPPKSSPGGGGGKGPKHQGPGGSGGSGGGGGNQNQEYNLLARFLPGILKGDQQSSSSNAGLPYAAPQTVGGGAPSLLVIGGIVLVGGFAFWYLHKHKGSREHGE